MKTQNQTMVKKVNRKKFLEYRMNLINAAIKKYELLAGIYSRSDYEQCKLYDSKINYLNSRWLELDDERQKLIA